MQPNPVTAPGQIKPGQLQPAQRPPAARPPAQQPRSRQFRSLRVVLALIMRETGSRETRTSLGFLWTMLEPVMTVLILSYCFSLIQRSPWLGTNFQMFYVTGVVPYHLFNHVAGRVSTSVRFSANLLGFPSVTVIDILMSRFLLNVFTNVLVFILLVVAVVWYYDLRVYPDLYRVGVGLSMAAAMGLGVGTLNSVLFLASSAYETLWGVINRPMSIFAGVMFPITTLPDYIFDILKWLPQAHLVAEMRGAFYPALDDNFVMPGYVFGISAICFVVGLIGLHRHVFDLLERR